MPLGRIMQHISKIHKTEIANFSGLLGRVLTEMRLVKVSNTERKELDVTRIQKLGVIYL